jgi:hypothetical protein
VIRLGSALRHQHLATRPQHPGSGNVMLLAA